MEQAQTHCCVLNTNDSSLPRGLLNGNGKCSLHEMKKQGLQKNEQTCSLQLSDSVFSLVTKQLLGNVFKPGQLSNMRHATQHTPHDTRQPGPPFQDLTSGWKQPESDSKDVDS